jgi:hypothetical protein
VSVFYGSANMLCRGKNATHLCVLLVVNVLYLGWKFSQDKAENQKKRSFAPMPTDVHALMMLKEMAGNTARETDTEGAVNTDRKKTG